MADNKIYDPNTGHYNEDYISDPNALLPDSYYGVGGGGTTVDGPAANNPFIQNMTIDEWQGHGGAIDEYGTPQPPWWNDVDKDVQDAYLKDKARFYTNQAQAEEMAHSNIDGLLGRANLTASIPGTASSAGEARALNRISNFGAPKGQDVYDDFGNRVPEEEMFGTEGVDYTETPMQSPADNANSGKFMGNFGTGQGAIANFFRNKWKR